ncbi:phage holin family protein [Arthrobacter sp. zg-Y859]|uniref:Phage holin family protein n=1 Tax=Arthrobacter jinronghuae TaxID=2964609 RepID=A0ABT1NTE9_9MICC|nr:phage holin family protein [Arthrobacter jinronghuae]MCQ1949841.1 phage holin family protein [Arthrobacter jinronghuae]UWX79991.1 phage holin family protein [Arthrobacter jinronghuae]
MKNLLITCLLQILAASAALLLSMWWVPGFRVQWPGFVATVLVVVLAQAVMTPLTNWAAKRYAPAFLGGTGLATALLALVIASTIPAGVSNTGIGNWILSALILWVASAAGSAVAQVLASRRRGTPGQAAGRA